MDDFFHRDNRILEEHPWISSLLQVVTLVLTISLFLLVLLSWKQHWMAEGGLLTLVSGSSMNPTLQDGQLLYTEKMDQFLRQDIVSLTMPETNQTFEGVEPGDLLVKRIIGLPGEHLRIDSDGRIYIGQEYLWEPYLEKNSRGDSFNDYVDGRIMEITLKDDEYFVMGDNRGDSLDSRAFGPVKEERIRASVSPSPTKRIYLEGAFLLILGLGGPLLCFYAGGPLLQNTASILLEKRNYTD